MSKHQLSLSDYLSTVQKLIRLSFDEPTWIKAEIRNLSIKGRHYYIELAEKEEDIDKVIASCKATIWKSTAIKLYSGLSMKVALNFQVT